jgi:cardiolipin synthase
VADLLEPTPPGADRIATIPNALSALRLLGVPLFLWLALGPERDGLAVLVMMVAGFTDWLDGKLARALNQYSSLGRLLDPLADRLYILAAIVALVLRDVLPLWLALAIVARDVVLAFTLPVLRKHGYEPLQVHFIGKAATMNLLYALPLLLLGDGTSTLADIARPTGWAFVIWGTALYWYAALLYLEQIKTIVVTARRESAAA